MLFSLYQEFLVKYFRWKMTPLSVKQGKLPLQINMIVIQVSMIPVNMVL